MSYTVVILNPGTGGKEIAVDRISAVDFQRVKLSYGLEGVAYDLATPSAALEISKGNIIGHGVVNKFGENPEIAADATEDIWDGGGTYSFPTTADITHISQATDQAAMRGQNIEVQGLDTNWDLVVQTVALNAANTTTAVALTTALRRVFRMKVLADVVGAYDISVKNSGGTTTYATMQAGNNQTLMAIYTVPAGKTAYLTNIYGGVVKQTNKDPTSTEFKVWMADRGNSYEFQLKHLQAVPAGGIGIKHTFMPFGSVDEKTDIKLSATCLDEPGKVHAGFDLILVDN